MTATAAGTETLSRPAGDLQFGRLSGHGIIEPELFDLPSTATVDPSSGSEFRVHLGMSVTTATVNVLGVVASVVAAALPSTDLFALPYDFDNNDLIDFGDNAHFRGAFS